MMLLLKILLAVFPFLFLMLSERTWTYILSAIVGFSWICLMLIPHINSNIPFKTDLMFSIAIVLMVVGLYLFFFGFDIEYDILNSIVIFIGATFMICGIIMGFIHLHFSDKNIITETTQTTTIESYNLQSVQVSEKLLGSLNGNTQGYYFLIGGKMTSEVDGTLTTVDVVKYWYDEGNGYYAPGQVEKSKVRYKYIENGENPHLDKKITKEITTKTDYNEMKKSSKEEIISEIYYFSIPKNSELEVFDLT